jgi:hypothetical protein
MFRLVTTLAHYSPTKAAMAELRWADQPMQLTAIVGGFKQGATLLLMQSGTKSAFELEGSFSRGQCHASSCRSAAMPKCSSISAKWQWPSTPRSAPLLNVAPTVSLSHTGL